tara:strand:+ start:1023 stop:1406 length:384 start_codon:yes stop_codon:yes gene_type:complete
MSDNNEKEQTVYQQGDVILTKVDNFNDTTSRYSSKEYKFDGESNKVTIMLGEGTGHHHRFEYQNELSNVIGYSRDWERLPTKIKITGEPATLKHEEHNSINIPSGYYFVTQVREFDHIGGITRSVVD